MRSIQSRILIIFFIIGVIIILGIGGFFGYIINNTNNILRESADIGINQITLVQDMQLKETKILILSSILVFCCIVILLGIYVYITIIKPMDELVKNTQKMAKSTDKELIKLKKNKKKRRKTEVDVLFNIIGKMTGDLKKSLDQLKIQKNEIEAIFLHMNDGIIAFDSKGKIVQINPAAKKLLNIDENMTFADIFNKENTQIKMDAILYLSNWTSSEQRMTIGDKTLNIFLAPFKDENNFSSGVIAVIQDITEHVKLDNMRKEFIADVSHELKTPITSIISYADTLQDGEYDRQTTHKFLSVISSEGRRMADLVSDLLTLSRYDTNRISGREITEFDLGELAKQCQEKLSIQSKNKNQDMECLVTADVPPIKADKTGIERVILNVISNAIKYTPENGTIKIYVGFVYNDAYIKVIDNGIGIPKEDLGRIFERFYRVDKARTREMGGTGLGLSIAKEILEQNKGSIDIKSELGKGTEVVIRIPAVKKNNIDFNNYNKNF